MNEEKIIDEVYFDAVKAAYNVLNTLAELPSVEAVATFKVAITKARACRVIAKKALKEIKDPKDK